MVSPPDHSNHCSSALQTQNDSVTPPDALKVAIVWCKKLGITIERVLKNNGSYYKSKAFAKACRDLKVRHIRTKPYTPKTNGKAERFIQIALREWAYARAYNTSDERAEDLQLWTHLYNWHRPHRGIKIKHQHQD